MLWQKVCLRNVIVNKSLFALPFAFLGFINRIFTIVSPYFLLAESCDSIPPSLLVYSIPAIHNQSVFLSFGMRKYVEYMSLAHIVHRPIIVKVVCFPFFNIHIVMCFVRLYSFLTSFRICSIAIYFISIVVNWLQRLYRLRERHDYRSFKQFDNAVKAADDCLLVPYLSKFSHTHNVFF